MEIRKVSDKSILIEGKNAKILVEPSEKEIKNINPDIILSASDDSKFSIVTPGEYEAKDVWILAMNDDPNEIERNNIYVLNVDNIKVGILDGVEKSLSKRNIEKIGIVDILITFALDNVDNIVSNITEIDPRVLIPMNFKKEVSEKVVKELGIKTITEEKKLKLKADEFNEEEYVTSLVNLI